MKQRIERFTDEDTGPTLAEYGLMSVAVAVVVITALLLHLG